MELAKGCYSRQLITADECECVCARVCVPVCTRVRCDWSCMHGHGQTSPAGGGIVAPVPLPARVLLD